MTSGRAGADQARARPYLPLRGNAFQTCEAGATPEALSPLEEWLGPIIFKVQMRRRNLAPYYPSGLYPSFEIAPCDSVELVR
jgi:hypothetical protein